MSLRQRLAVLTGLSALAIAATVGWVWLQPRPVPPGPVTTAQKPAEPPPSPERSDRRAAPAPSIAEAQPARADLEPVAGDIDAALMAHGRSAAPRWRRTGAILVQSDRPELQAAAEDMAARMDEAADGLPAAYRQELMMEERQLLATLRRRYAGFEPLEAELDQLDAELAALEAIPTTPVASPPPRGSAARPE
jgi:hypothetical protein